MLTPVDLETTVFRRGFRGYRTIEVQEFMEQVTTDFERLYKENKVLKDEKERLEAEIIRYQQVEETLRNTLVLAQQTAEDVKNAGQKQADLILQEAQHRADQIKARVREEIQGELQKLASLRQQVDLFRHQFKKFLEGMADAVDSQIDMQDFWDKLQSYSMTMDKEVIAPITSPAPEPVNEQETSATKSREAPVKSAAEETAAFRELDS